MFGEEVKTQTVFNYELKITTLSPVRRIHLAMLERGNLRIAPEALGEENLGCSPFCAN